MVRGGGRIGNFLWISQPTGEKPEESSKDETILGPNDSFECSFTVFKKERNYSALSDPARGSTCIALMESPKKKISVSFPTVTPSLKMKCGIDFRAIWTDRSNMSEFAERSHQNPYSFHLGLCFGERVPKTPNMHRKNFTWLSPRRMVTVSAPKPSALMNTPITLPKEVRSAKI